MVIGRFAPSPTGPLHFGSLVAAVASYCDAKKQGGQWLLRIEDIDSTRCSNHAANEIIQSLIRYGFEWDGEVVYQSQRSEFYQHALDQLIERNWAYPCTCSRKEIADSGSISGIEGTIYPGTCQHQPLKSNTPTAWRVKTTHETIAFHDAIQGKISHHLATDIGDFILKRADGLFSYQLAVVVDDALQHVTHVVRGADLLNSTTRQIYLQQHLAYPTPMYAHIPLATHPDGQKLSKQNLAQALPEDNITETLLSACEFLQQPIPKHRNGLTLKSLWDWIITHWELPPPRANQAT